MIKIFYKKENILSILLILVIFLFDRFSKLKILKDFSESNYFISDFINFDLVWNTGIGFGLLTTETTILYNLTTIFIALVITYLIYYTVKLENFDKFFFSVIIGGALGNFYDRLAYKAVPDFIDFHVGNFHWFTFNIADIFITLGIVGYLIKGLLEKK